MSDFYREHILDHYAHPRNWGRLKNPDIVADSDDPSCGDQVHLELALDEGGRVSQVAFEGEGCMVSMASASIFTEYLRGKSLEDLERLTEEEVLALLDAPIPPSRRRCALAPLVALRAGLQAYRR
ncbi:MAG: iron-sulfur cluster assembly scaffold protein [Anaerolineae bacterium]|nr:iron-sulfur cluster assembly scaffold protein [Anaerolineae bacterium]MCX8067576.1 iron-sulfur cluster assembly scaffold protein [Anaerolineae bacterium]MDW7991409.1 iron-sulfur cluster assembly scaffold protein [Anaerolineae bacterium]